MCSYYFHLAYLLSTMGGGGGGVGSAVYRTRGRSKVKRYWALRPISEITILST